MFLICGNSHKSWIYQLNFENCGNYSGNTKKNHRPIKSLHKTSVLRPSSKFKSHFNLSSTEKNFLKV
ncbi:hypothetical protein C5473_04875 [Leptospira interrogans serovar Weerasinghe]|nr:hypothetical protein C5473_04875 [Leptospira interrogans serovar Weerasinghe]